MLSKIKKFKDQHLKFRRIWDEINDFVDKITVINYIICFTFVAVTICVPTIVAFFCLPENVRVWISSIIGGVLSLIIIPLLINHIKRKQKKADELYEINKPLYQELSIVFIKLLADEYMFHGGNIKATMKISANDDKVKEIVAPLKEFICDNYNKMCNTFSVRLIWNIIDVYNECLYSITRYVNIEAKIEKCFRKMRRDSGAKGLSCINRIAITMRCPNNHENT